MEAYVRLDRELPSGFEIEGRDVPERDLVVELSICRAHGRSLIGLPPQELLGEIPASWVLAVGDAQLTEWQAIGEDPVHAHLTVLTACRGWHFAVEGKHSSKTAAAEWALRRDPSLRVISQVLEARRAGMGVVDAAGVSDLLYLVRREIAVQP